MEMKETIVTLLMVADLSMHGPINCTEW